MSISLANSASTSDGPALNTFVETFAGDTALSKSFDATPSTAWAWVRLAKYPIRTSAGPEPPPPPPAVEVVGVLEVLLLLSHPRVPRAATTDKARATINFIGHPR